MPVPSLLALQNFTCNLSYQLIQINTQLWHCNIKDLLAKCGVHLQPCKTNANHNLAVSLQCWFQTQYTHERNQKVSVSPFISFKNRFYTLLVLRAVSIITKPEMVQQLRQFLAMIIFKQELGSQLLTSTHTMQSTKISTNNVP